MKTSPSYASPGITIQTSLRVGRLNDRLISDEIYSAVICATRKVKSLKTYLIIKVVFVPMRSTIPRQKVDRLHK